jgi:hypothetical protein
VTVVTGGEKHVVDKLAKRLRINIQVESLLMSWLCTNCPVTSPLYPYGIPKSAFANCFRRRARFPMGKLVRPEEIVKAPRARAQRNDYRDKGSDFGITPWLRQSRDTVP